MRRTPRRRHRAQLMLALAVPRPEPCAGTEAEGLLQALADLLLEAAKIEATTRKGGADEHPDHA